MSIQPYLSLFAGCLVVIAGWVIRAWLEGRFKVGFPKSVRPAAELAVHIISGTVLFSLVFAAAAAINFLIDFFVARGLAPNWIVMPTHILEAVVWSGDVAAFLLFTAVQLLTFSRETVALAKRGTSATIECGNTETD